MTDDERQRKIRELMDQYQLLRRELASQVDGCLCTRQGMKTAKKLVALENEITLLGKGDK